MKFDKLTATIRRPRMLKTTIQSVGGSQPQHVTMLEIPVDVVVDEKSLAGDAWRRLFPFADSIITTIAGREGEDKRGLDMKARGPLGSLDVTIWDTRDVAGAVPAFVFPLAETKGRASLGINEDGKAVLSFTFRAWLTSDQLGRLGPYTDGEVVLDTVSRAPELPLSTPSDAANAITARARAKAAKEEKPLIPEAIFTDDDGKVFVMNGQAQTLFAEAKRKGTIANDDAAAKVLTMARSAARLAGSSKAKRLTVTAEDVQEALVTLDGGAAATH